MDPTVRVLDEGARWRARDVTYLEGAWDQLCNRIPKFELADFQVAPDEPPNPFMRSVVRLPTTKTERAIPVGVVSNSYTLAQHREVAARCMEGIRNAGIKTSDLKCQLGLTELGEWMHLSIYFPDRFNHVGADGNRLGGSYPSATWHRGEVSASGKGI